MEDEEERGSDVVALIRGQQVETVSLAADIPHYLYEPAFSVLSAEVVRDYGLVVDGTTRTVGLEIRIDGFDGFLRAKRLVQDVYGYGPAFGRLLEGVRADLAQHRATLGIWGRAGSGDPAISVRFDGSWPKLPVLSLLGKCGVPEAGVESVESTGQQLALGDVGRFAWRIDAPGGGPWFEVVYRNRPADADAMAARLVAEAGRQHATAKQQAWLSALLNALRNPLDWPVGVRADLDGPRPGISVGTRDVAASTAIALLQPFAGRERIGQVLGAMIGATGADDRFSEVTLRTRDAEPPEILLRVRGVET